MVWTLTRTTQNGLSESIATDAQSPSKGANVIIDFEKGDKLRIKGSVAWAQEDFGLLGTYKKGTLALIGEFSVLLELVG